MYKGEMPSCSSSGWIVVGVEVVGAVVEVVVVEDVVGMVGGIVVGAS